MTLESHSALASLRLRWLLASIVGTGLLVAGYFLLHSEWSPQYAIRWVMLSAIIIGYEVVLVWRALPRNHRHAESQILPTLGLGNILTLARGFLLGLLGGFLFSPWPGGWLAWVPGILYTAAGIFDYLDGIAARKTNHATALGEYLDLEFDALGVLIAPLLGVWYGQLPIWYLLVSAARYLFAAGIWRLERQGKRVYNLTPSTNRRIFAGFQMGMVGIVLWPIFSPPGTWVVSTVFMLPFLVGFIRDWLVVSGKVTPESRAYIEWMGRFRAIATRWLPFGIRLAILGIGSAMGAAALLRIPVPDTPPLGSVEPGIWSLVLALSLIIGSGTAARAASLALLMLIGFFLLPHQLDWPLVLAAGAASIAILGSGAASVWRPEEYYLRRRFGGLE